MKKLVYKHILILFEIARILCEVSVYWASYIDNDFTTILILVDYQPFLYVFLVKIRYVLKE